MRALSILIPALLLCCSCGGAASKNITDGSAGTTDGSAGTTDGSGAIDCGAGKTATTAATLTRIQSIAGGWHFVGIRASNGSDAALSDPACDPSTTYFFSASINAPTSSTLSSDDEVAAACAVTNNDTLRVYGGTNTGTYPNCVVLACGPGTNRMTWDPDAEIGYVFNYDANGVKGMMIYTVTRDTVDPTRILMRQGATTWIAARGGVPTCS